MVGVLSLMLMTPLFAKQKAPAPQVELTAKGKQLEAEYKRRDAMLEAEKPLNVD